MKALEQLTVTLCAQHGPGWQFLSFDFSREGDTLVLHGALPETMHFGRATIDLRTGWLTFVDEDHRDGGDWELKRVQLSDAERALLAELK